MRWQDERRSENIEDRRGDGPRMSGFPMPGGRAGGISGLGLVIVIVISLITGVNPLSLLQGMGGMGGGGTEVAPQEQAPPAQTSAAEEQLKEFVAVVLADTEDFWTGAFQRSGSQYPVPKLVLYRGQTPTACGTGQTAAGPFYCPGDQKVYLDLAFFDELGRRFGAPGDFAMAYVIAHEVGHHIQTITGIEEQVRKAQQRARDERQSNAYQVRMELQADCYAGLWAHNAQRTKDIVEQGDIEEALGAAQAVGDDTLQKQAQGHVVPDAFTHGSAEQRARWFMTGFKSGSLDRCDTFSAREL